MNCTFSANSHVVFDIAKHGWLHEITLISMSEKREIQLSLDFK